MAKKADPFKELQARGRRVTPKVLRGEQKAIWDQFVEKYHNDQFAGLSMSQLFDWAKKHCGLTCSVSCFRNALLNQDG